MFVSMGAGLVFGLAVALFNTWIVHRAMKKNSGAALSVAMAVRMLLDMLALAAVYLTRHVLPLRFEPTLIATAVGLSAGLIGLAVLSSRRKKTDRSGETGGE